MRAYCVALGMAAILAVLACGDDSDGGAAGAPAAPGPGERCGGPGTCGTDGVSCQPAGTRFPRLCSTQCNNDGACVQIQANLGCFQSFCALRCETPELCPQGTVCTAIDNRMACVPDGT